MKITLSIFTILLSFTSANADSFECYEVYIDRSKAQPKTITFNEFNVFHHQSLGVRTSKKLSKVNGYQMVLSMLHDSGSAYSSTFELQMKKDGDVNKGHWIVTHLNPIHSKILYQFPEIKHQYIVECERVKTSN